MYMQPDREGDGGGGGDLAGRQQGGMLVEIRHVEYNVSPHEVSRRARYITATDSRFPVDKVVPHGQTT